MDNSEKNPFIILCKASQKKNIDGSFIETLKALIFFNQENIKKLINEKYENNFIVNVDTKTSESNWFNNKTHSKQIKLINNKIDNSDEFFENLSFTEKLNKIITKKTISQHTSWNSGEEYEVIEHFHFGEFLLDKLSENFRRLYSAHRNGGKIPQDLGSTIEQLKEQQNQIYNALELISPHIDFGSENRLFNKLFFGKFINCSNSQAFFYMSLHEHLLIGNEEKHKNILKHNFNINDVNSSIIIDLVNLSYPKEKHNFISEIIQLLPDNFYKNIGFHLKDNTFAKGSFAVNIFLHCAEKNIDISLEQKSLLFNSIMHTHGYLCKQPALLSNIIFEKIKNYTSDIDKSKIQSRSIIPSFVNKNCITDLALLLTDKLTNPNFFVDALNDSIEDGQREKIFNKYDLFDQEILLAISSKISQSGLTKKVKMQKFISLVGENLNNDSISKILASDVSFFEIIKPLYMNIKLNKEISSDLNTIKNRKIKI